MALLGGIAALWTGAAWSAEAQATYTARFDSTWSEETHPLYFPSTAHFSGLIGGTHNGEVEFWREGELASTGIKDMSERGRKSPLDAEVQAAIAAGNAGQVISGPGIGLSPGTASVSFTATREFPLVTLVSMIAPSPDWFVGVSGLSLFRDGRWVEELVVELQPYDAGTDSGAIYTSPDEVTVPFEPISHLTSGPFANGLTLGTYTFTRTDPPAPSKSFLRGDSNGDGARDISDAVSTLGFLFLAGPVPPCEKSVDVNDDGTVNVADPIALLAHLLLGGPQLAEPFSACGSDPTSDDLTCDSDAACR
jgi:hypothetical protein